ncbi:MAG: hypothetical protein ABUK01_10490 [Leptospirales bacterium]
MKFYFKKGTIISVFLLLLFAGLSCKGTSKVNRSGKSGSFARMNIVGDYLYTLNKSKLTVHRISDPYSPVKVREVEIDDTIETLFPVEDKLFIGSTNGMFIYDIAKPERPTLLGQYSHFTACDPVVTQNNYAYITLRSGTGCQNSRNELHIIDIKNIVKPELVKEYRMKNPHGLAIDNDLLFIAEGDYGLKIFDVKNPYEIKRLKHIENMNAYDIILQNSYLYVIGKDGLYIYDYRYFPERPIHKVSKISIREPFTVRFKNKFKDISIFKIILIFYSFMLTLLLWKAWGAKSAKKRKVFKIILIVLVAAPLALLAVLFIVFLT